MQPEKNQVQTDETFISRKEAAKLLNVNLVTFSRYTKNRQFPFYRAGKKLLFRKSEILDAIRVGQA